MAPPRALLQKDRVLVPDEKDANTLYNKGSFGVPQSGGGLLLDLVEAVYLVENHRLAVDGHDAGSLLRAASALEPGFEARYVVYRDLRGRTFVVKPSNLTDYNVYARGALPGKSASTHLVRCASERESLDAAALLEEVDRAARVKKLLLVALVDEEGDLTYYDVTSPDVRAAAQKKPAAGADGFLVGDRVLVLDEDQARMLFGEGHFGRAAGIGHHLSLPEAVHLADAGKLRVRDAAGRREIAAAELAREAERLEPDFPLRRALYADLRRRGLVPKTGFKFGTHFRVYAGSPEAAHSPYLAHALPRDRRVPWPEVAGFVRLAHGVRKRLFFAVPQADGFRLLELARTKP